MSPRAATLADHWSFIEMDNDTCKTRLGTVLLNPTRTDTARHGSNRHRNDGGGFESRFRPPVIKTMFSNVAS